MLRGEGDECDMLRGEGDEGDVLHGDEGDVCAGNGGWWGPRAPSPCPV